MQDGYKIQQFVTRYRTRNSDTQYRNKSSNDTIINQNTTGKLKLPTNKSLEIIKKLKYNSNFDSTNKRF